MEKSITQEELLEELSIAIKDVFVASVIEKDGEIELSFLNGQKFLITVKEV